MKGHKHHGVIADELHFVSVAEVRSPYMDFRRKMMARITKGCPTIVVWEPHPNHHERFLVGASDPNPLLVEKSAHRMKH